MTYPGFADRDLRGGRWMALSLTIAAHLAVLFALQLTHGRVRFSESLPDVAPVQLIWLRSPTPHNVIVPAVSVAKNNAPRRVAPISVAPIMPPATVNASPSVSPSPPVTPADTETGGTRLDLAQVLKGVSADIAKSDAEQPKGRGNHGDGAVISSQSPFEKALAKAAASARPKWNQPARIDEITTGAQADEGRRVYKITTFLGAYCVYYYPDKPKTEGMCPINF